MRFKRRTASIEPGSITPQPVSTAHSPEQIAALLEENRHLRSEVDRLQRLSEREPTIRPQQMGMVRSIVGLDEKIIQLDEHNQIEYINSAMSKMLGIDRKEVLGKSVAVIDQYHWGAGVLQRQIEEAKTSGGEREIEKSFHEPDKPLHDTVVIIKTTILQGKAQIIIQDVTKQRVIETTFKRMVSPEVMQKVMDLGKDYSRAERYEMSVIFGDLRGFTTTAQHADADVVRAMCNEFLTAMTEVIMQHQGTIDKYIGDEVMGLFGAPYYYEDHAIKALNAAIEMQIRHAELMQTWRSRNWPTLALGIGVNTGEMVVGLVGSELRSEFTVLGHHVNLAARLCGLAGPGDIWLGSRTFELIKKHVQTYGPNAGITVNVKFKPAGKIQAKGIDEPVDIVNVLLKD